MKNKEFFKDEIMDIAKDGYLVAVVAGKPTKCRSRNCIKCDLYGECTKARAEWFEAEYEPPKIDLPENLEINAPIYVKDHRGVWLKRHFAAFNTNHDKVYTFAGGRTSWSNENFDHPFWEYAKMPDEGEINNG